jgi:hypothetical protein
MLLPMSLLSMRTTDVELRQLILGDLRMTGLEQVLSVFPGIFHQVTPEQVNHHPYQHPQGSVVGSFTPDVKHAEDGLVHAYHNLFPELVMPRFIFDVIVLHGVFKILGG